VGADLAAAGDAVWFYLGKLLWPHPLIAIYPRWQIDAGPWVSYLPLLAVIVILSVFWFKRRSGVAGSRACFFAFAYFMAALLPILGLVDNFIFQFSFVFDHFQYLASIGPLALAGAGLARFSDMVIPKNPWLQSGLCAGLLLFLGMASWERTWVYQSQETLWTDTLTKNPTCWVGQYNLGSILLQKGQVDKALEHFQNAVEINPNYLEAHSNLGLALLQKGQMDEAVAHFKKASEIAPNSLSTHYNLGVALFRNGELDEAVAQYRKALEINPNSLETHYNLGLTLFKKRQLDEAIAQFLEVLRLKPDFSPAQDYLARAQALVRRRDGFE